MQVMCDAVNFYERTGGKVDQTGTHTWRNRAYDKVSYCYRLDEYQTGFGEINMFKVIEFEKDDIDKVISFECELREQEPDTYYWEPDATYKKQLEQSFEDVRFNTALSFIAVKEDKVIGRIDASLISSRSDASCFSAYMDWICVLKRERHHKVAQALLNALKEKCKEQGVGVLVALTANNDEAQSFYKSVENASMHDTGIWIDIQ